ASMVAASASRLTLGTVTSSLSSLMKSSSLASCLSPPGRSPPPLSPPVCPPLGAAEEGPAPEALEESTATVDGDHLAGHPARPLRGEELHAVGDVLGLPQPSQRDAGHQV